MPWDGYPTTLFKAVRLANGKNVCVELDMLTSTTKVVKTEGEFDYWKGQGWSEHPLEAMDRLEKQQDDVSTAAAERAYDDQHMSEAALAEAAKVEQSTSQHIAEIPRKRGRPKKKAE